MRRLLYALALVVIASQAGAMTLDDYIATLERIPSLVAAGQIAAARAAAQPLHDQTIDSPKGRFHADETILAALAKDPIDSRFPARLATTIAELRAARGAAAVVRDPDMSLVDKIDKEQQVPKPGGAGDVDFGNDDRMLKAGTAMQDAFAKVGKVLGDFFEWLGSFWPETKTQKEKKQGSIRGIVIAIAVVIVAVIALLAWNAVRGARRAAPALASSIAAIPSARDEDPLSRASTEWEQYAAQLAGAGRYREAIRAWYHAVLVTLYGASILHFRKGRTNWEYVAALSPSLAWRTRFIVLTRRFEYEWYGASESTSEAFDECAREARAVLGAVARPVRGAA